MYPPAAGIVYLPAGIDAGLYGLDGFFAAGNWFLVFPVVDCLVPVGAAAKRGCGMYMVQQPADTAFAGDPARKPAVMPCFYFSPVCTEPLERQIDHGFPHGRPATGCCIWH